MRGTQVKVRNTYLTDVQVNLIIVALTEYMERRLPPNAGIEVADRLRRDLAREFPEGWYAFPEHEEE